MNSVADKPALNEAFKRFQRLPELALAEMAAIANACINNETKDSTGRSGQRRPITAGTASVPAVN